MNPLKRSILTLTILSLVAVTPVWADQSMGPEIPISVLDNQQYNPHVAYNSVRDQYLVVWHNFWGGSRDIYGRRLDGEGNLLSYFTISTGTFDRVQPAVAYDPLNDRYLVVWSYDFHGNGSDWDLYGRLIPWNGPDAGLTEFSIETSTRTQDSSEVAFALAQQEFMVVWTNSGGGVPKDIEGARIQLDGSISGFVPVASGATDRTNPDIAYNLDRNEYLVTYDDLGANILATRLTGNGVVLGSGEFGIATWPNPESRPSVAACGGGTDRYFVAWQSQVSATDNDVYGRFVTGDGVPDGAPVHFPHSTIDDQNPDVTCGRGLNEYFVVWEAQYSSTTGPFGIDGMRVLPNGTLFDHVSVRPVWVGETGVATMPAAVGGEQGYLVVWEHDRQGTSYQDIHGRMVWGALFSDGFESGNTNAWSSVTP